MVNVKLPDEVLFIISTLENNGYCTFVVGSCVRDLVIGKEPEDWNIYTQALPEKITECFAGQQSIETMIQHGTVTLLLNRELYEITSFRMCNIDTGNRNRCSVALKCDLTQDLSRRDFTVNAIAYHPEKGLIDSFGGISDIKNRVIRCIGDANVRFREDALLIMRAVRLYSELGFCIESITATAMYANCHFLNDITSERILYELNHMLVGNYVGDALADFAPIIGAIIPEIIPMINFVQNTPYHDLDVWSHTVKSISCIPSVLTLRLTMLLHDIAKPLCFTESIDGVGHYYRHPQKSADMAKEILTRLRYDNSTIKNVVKLILYHDMIIEPNKKHIERWISRVGVNTLSQLIEVKRADVLAQSEAFREERLNVLDSAEMQIDSLIRQNRGFSLNNLAVDGNDMIEVGVAQGIQVGKVLNCLLEMVIDEEVKNDRDLLMEKARELYMCSLREI